MAAYDQNGNNWLELQVRDVKDVPGNQQLSSDEEEIGYDALYALPEDFSNFHPERNRGPDIEEKLQTGIDGFLTGRQAHPVKENTYSDVDFDIHMERRHTRQFDNKLLYDYTNKVTKLLFLLKNIEILDNLRTAKTNDESINNNVELTPNVNGLDKTKTATKRYIVSLSIPPLRYMRRRKLKLKGKRLRTYVRYRPFRIDPTYFLLGIGKR